MTTPFPDTLYCVPYAGGTGQAYARLGRRAGPGLRLAGLDLPGRGLRRSLPPARALPQAVAALAGQVQEELRARPPSGPYGILGHSFGALLAHRLAAELSRSAAGPPALLVVSGCPPPHLLGRLDGTAEELLQAATRELRATVSAGADHSAVWDAAAEAGRQDLALLEQGATATPPVLGIPVVGLYGADDPFRPGETMAGWARWTRAGFTLRAVPGGHFCFREHPEPYLDALRSQPMSATGSRG
ncbi:thioesterase II family protein [Streptomyces chattanoogensis]|uniref:Thioesterase domain-containing protein n=1 Tax=Streptomyces chattanoogensis TaxID=66876 RepID=A0A0N0Y0Z1_9ACTN|nr:alpha/beta fold hydrolase [Streptomyces chattanoogensis]KPC65293.1 hypothetical protein ADL29_08020 [Streptomyces chattanoogensis]